MTKKSDSKPAYISHGTVSVNRKARHEYFIEETLEAGLMLTGSEVKSLRRGRANIAEAHAAEKDGAIYLLNANIQPWESGGYANHEATRPRKLLLHRKQMSKLLGQVQQKGVTLVPLKLYFNDRGIAKLELGLARGKKQYEKRETEKQRDWDREEAALFKKG